MFRKARNKSNCHKSNDYGRVTIQAEREEAFKGSFGSDWIETVWRHWS
jgi:hypothetical protein